jgi:hypothetical protein
MNTVDHQVYAAMLNDMSHHIHHVNVVAGWWTDKKLGDLKTPELMKYTVGTKLALVHSEVSEATEGFRKDLMDDHLKTRKMVEVELADTFIRIFDLAGALNLDLGGAVIDKLAYNTRRPDHKPEAREGEGGKSI